MRKSWKRILALACAAAMIVPSTAPMSARAAEEELGGAIGDSTIEFDNSELPNIANVILSTITDTTYDFRVDPETLLYQFNAGLYDNTNMFFENDDTTKLRTFVLPTSYSFYLKSMTKLTGTASAGTSYTNSTASVEAFLAKIVTSTTTYTQFIEDLEKNEYYIWQPVDDGMGSGEYVRLEEGNYELVVTLEVNEDTDKITAKIPNATPRQSEGDIAAIWDGEIYVPTYAPETDITGKIMPLFDVEAWIADSQAFDESVYVGLTSQGSTPIYYFAGDMEVSDEIETPEAFADEEYIQIKYSEAELKYQNKSRAATIVNKSTFDIAVTASVQMTGGEGLTLDDSDAFDGTADTAGANIYLAIQNADGTKENALAAPTKAKTTSNEEGQTVPVTGEAKAYYILKGTGEDSVLYHMGEPAENTNGYVYYRYLNTTASAKKNQASFVITGATDTEGFGSSAEAQKTADWESYIENLANGTVSRPQINVVYTFEKVTADATDAVFATDDLDLYQPASAITNSGWVELTQYTDTVVEFEDSVAIEDNAITDLAVANFEDSNDKIKIKSATIGKQDVTAALKLSAGVVKLDNTKAAITALLATNAGGSDAITDTLTITLTVNGVEKSFTKEVSIKEGVVATTALTPSAVTWTVNNASGATFTPVKAIVVSDVKSVTVNWTVANGSAADLAVTADEYTVTKNTGAVVIDTTKVTEITTADKINKITVVYDINGKDVTVEYSTQITPQ